MTSSSVTDDQLRLIVDKIFDKYDKDKSFTLDVGELKQVLLDTMGSKTTEDQVNQFLKAIDSNNDGKVTKMELFNIIKKFINHKN
jgi:Ca2+-binding EF-hand superfamily protein